MTTVGLLLAAGHSRRFGPEDKLTAIYHGRPLIRHSADTLRACALDHLIAVVRNPEVEKYLTDYRIVQLPDDGGPMSRSLSAGIAYAETLEASKVLVTLGDMPLVTRGHIMRVLDCAIQHGQSCTGDDHRRLPPACFSAEQFQSLMNLSGDKGANDLLRNMDPKCVVGVGEDTLKDIDLPTDIP